MPMTLMMMVGISKLKKIPHLRAWTWKIPISACVDPLTAIAMVQRQATEQSSQVVEALAGTFNQAMVWCNRISILTIQTTTPQCRCMCSSRAATRGSRDKISSTWCNSNKYPVPTVLPIRTWPLFIIKGLRRLSRKVVYRQQLDHSK